MTSYEFETTAINAVIEYLRNQYIPVTIKSLDIVWLADELSYKKCLILGVPMKNKYAEIIYDKDINEIAMNIYQKNENIKKPVKN